MPNGKQASDSRFRRALRQKPKKAQMKRVAGKPSAETKSKMGREFRKKDSKARKPGNWMGY